MKFALLALTFGGLALANTVSVDWSSVPVVGGVDCFGCPYGAPPPLVTATQTGTNGANADLQASDSNYAWNAVSSDWSVSDTFTLASPADVLLSAVIGYSSWGSSCTPIGCDGPGWQYSGEFSGGISIIGSDGEQVFGVSFGNSVTQASTCEFGDCSSDILLSSDPSGSVYLAAGTYTLTVGYSDRNNSVGDSMSGASINVVLSDPVAAVPEPSYAGFIGLVPLFGLLCRRFSRRSAKV